jgi:2,3-bisphosphoglycerate-dependent phosphoglycerate mutase
VSNRLEPFHPSQPLSLFFVRHGTTELNFQGLRCGGDIDVPLTDIGCDQAYLLGKQIQKMDLGIEVMVAASLTRARQTALIISGVLGGVPIESEPLLNERFLGAWNRRPIAETEALLLKQATPPGGESEDEFSARIAGALEKLRPRLVKRTLVVSSKGVGRVLNTLLGGEGRLQVGNGEIVEFCVTAAANGKLALSVNRPHQV